jgi:hypothetical protein
MRRHQKAVEKRRELPRTPTKKPKREKLVRVTNENYFKLAKLGDLTEDYNDVITKLLKFWEEHHKSE